MFLQPFHGLVRVVGKGIQQYPQWQPWGNDQDQIAFSDTANRHFLTKTGS